MSGTQSGTIKSKSRERLGFGQSQKRKVVDGIVKEKYTESQEQLFQNSIPGKFKAVVKPVIKKSLKAFLSSMNMLIKKKNYKQVKIDTEKALKTYDYGQIPVDG